VTDRLGGKQARGIDLVDVGIDPRDAGEQLGGSGDTLTSFVTDIPANEDDDRNQEESSRQKTRASKEGHRSASGAFDHVEG
jgi:hypothetical protein